MFKKYFKKTVIISALGIFLLAPAALAQGNILPAETGQGDTVSECGSPNGCGNYSLNDFLTLAVNISKWILGVVGSVVLFFFIYGGFLFIFSGGSSDKVEDGKNMLIGSIVGLVIVFTSYIIIQFAMTAMGIDGGWQVSGWFGK
jgi:hypothetical protein